MQPYANKASLLTAELPEYIGFSVSYLDIYKHADATQNYGHIKKVIMSVSFIIMYFHFLKNNTIF